MISFTFAYDFSIYSCPRTFCHKADTQALRPACEPSLHVCASSTNWETFCHNLGTHAWSPFHVQLWYAFAEHRCWTEFCHNLDKDLTVSSRHASSRDSRQCADLWRFCHNRAPNRQSFGLEFRGRHAHAFWDSFLLTMLRCRSDMNI